MVFLCSSCLWWRLLKFEQRCDYQGYSELLLLNSGYALTPLAVVKEHSVASGLFAVQAAAM